MAINIPVRKIVSSASSVLKNVPGPTGQIFGAINKAVPPPKPTVAASTSAPAISTVTRPATSNVAATTPKEQFINSLAQPTNTSTSSTSTSTPTPTITSTSNPTPNPTTSNSPLNDSYKKAFEDYINSLKPSADVTKTKTAYNNYVASAQLGVDNKEGQGRGIPLQLVRGQQEKLANQAEIEAKRLQGDIDIATQDQTTLKDQAKAKFDQYKPTEVGNNLVQIDPTTGEYKTVFSSPTKKEDFTLGEGQKRYDADGKLIASGPDKPVTLKQSLVKVNGKDYLVDENGNLTEPQIPASTAQTSELKGRALSSAKSLLDSFTQGGGSAAVGQGRLTGGGLLSRIPGTKTKDFQIAFDNLKSLLSLDNVSLLKGQGAVF